MVHDEFGDKVYWDVSVQVCVVRCGVRCECNSVWWLDECMQLVAVYVVDVCTL